MRGRSSRQPLGRATAPTAMVVCAIILAGCGGGTSTTDTRGAPPFTVPTAASAISPAGVTGSTTSASTTGTTTTDPGATGSPDATVTSAGTVPQTTPQTTPATTPMPTTPSTTPATGGTATAGATSTTGGAGLGQTFCTENPGACG